MPIKPTDEEEKYFAAREAEARATLRRDVERAAAATQERERIARAIDADLDVAGRIQELGFSAETAPVFDLLPLVHVAWADGKIQRSERALILQILEERGLAAGTPAFTMMASLLETRPSDDFFAATLSALRQVLGDFEGADLVELCARVARASGGLLGAGAMSSRERALIEDVARTLGPDAEARFRERLS